MDLVIGHSLDDAAFNLHQRETGIKNIMSYHNTLAIIVE